MTLLREELEAEPDAAVPGFSARLPFATWQQSDWSSASRRAIAAVSCARGTMMETDSTLLEWHVEQQHTRLHGPRAWP